MFYFFLWRDIVEILFFTALIYYFTLWLKKDRTKNLLPYFFGYCLITFIAWTIQLPTITPLLFAITPAALMIFILMHQETLQRNLVALKNITPATVYTEDWLETLLQSCLVIINKNKHVLCVIEHHDRLDEFITAPLLINARLQKGILELLLESPSYDHRKMIWVDTQGRLRAINGSWKQLQSNKTMYQQDVQIEDALLYTAQTDALMFQIDPVTRSFTIVAHEKKFEHVTAHHALQLIKKHIRPSKQTVTKGEFHETAKNNHIQQRTP